MTTKDPILNLIWVRHGYSCANYKKEKNKEKNIFGRLFGDKHYDISDPQLHEAGLEQSKDLAEDFNHDFTGQIDLICSSELLRSIETALTFSKNLNDDKKSSNISDKVLILPFINETSMFTTKDNVPKKIFKRCTGSTPTPPIAYCKSDPRLLFLDINTKYYEDSQFFTDYKKFKSIVLPEIYKLLIFFYGKKHHYNVVIVSHSNYLKEKVGFDYKPGNVQLGVQYDVFGYDIKVQEPLNISYFTQNYITDNFTLRNLKDWDAYSKGYNNSKKNTKRCDSNNDDFLPEKIYSFKPSKNSKASKKL